MLRAIKGPITVVNDLVVVKEVQIDLNGKITSLMFGHKYIPNKLYSQKLHIAFNQALNMFVCRQGFHSILIPDDIPITIKSLYGRRLVYAIIPKESTILIGDSNDIVSNNIIILDKIVSHHSSLETQRIQSEKFLLSKLGVGMAA